MRNLACLVKRCVQVVFVAALGVAGFWVAASETTAVGQKYCEVFVDGISMGYVPLGTDVRSLVLAARRELSCEEDECLCMEFEWEVVEEDEPFIKFSTEDELESALIEALRGTEIHEEERAYTVAFEEYSATFSSLDEVTKMLEDVKAAGDEDDVYGVEYVNAESHISGVMQAVLVRRDEMESDGDAAEADGLAAGEAVTGADDGETASVTNRETASTEQADGDAGGDMSVASATIASRLTAGATLALYVPEYAAGTSDGQADSQQDDSDAIDSDMQQEDGVGTDADEVDWQQDDAGAASGDGMVGRLSAGVVSALIGTTAEDVSVGNDGSDVSDEDVNSTGESPDEASADDISDGEDSASTGAVGDGLKENEAGDSTVTADDGSETVNGTAGDSSDAQPEYQTGLLDLDFVERISVYENYVDASDLADVETEVGEVTKEKESNQVYTVQGGDSLSVIAMDHDTTVASIVALNALSSENEIIREGQELIIAVPEPDLKLRVTIGVVYEEDYDEDPIVIENDSWYTTKEVVLEEGTTGHRERNDYVVYENGIEVSRTMVSQNIMVESEAAVIERGTIIPPTYIKPISGGYVTSNYGYRWGRLHKGVDWGCPTGTTVFASSGGTVTYAGWTSGYGYNVVISHPDGRMTRYAHLSKILVSVGQYVSQGETIAKSGSTGNSTGPHLHFEIYINGSPVNPLKYISG